MLQDQIRLLVNIKTWMDLEHKLEADGLLSVCLQHEIDHLNGRVFVDHLSRLKQEKIIRKLQKEKRRSLAEA